MTDNPFLGTWRLISWENRDDKGQLGYPLGPEAVGYITYTADGYIFAQIMAAQRTPLATQNPFGIASLSPRSCPRKWCKSSERLTVSGGLSRIDQAAVWGSLIKSS